MDIKYNWSIVKIECVDSDIISKVYWSCYASDDEGNTSIVNGWTELPPPSDEATPLHYNSLTQEQILSWCWNYVSKSSVEFQLEGQIFTSKSSVKQTYSPKKLPWEIVEEPVVEEVEEPIEEPDYL